MKGRIGVRGGKNDALNLRYSTKSVKHIESCNDSELCVDFKCVKFGFYWDYPGQI